MLQSKISAGSQNSQFTWEYEIPDKIDVSFQVDKTQYGECLRAAQPAQSWEGYTSSFAVVVV